MFVSYRHEYLRHAGWRLGRPTRRPSVTISGHARHIPRNPPRQPCTRTEAGIITRTRTVVITRTRTGTVAGTGTGIRVTGVSRTASRLAPGLVVRAVTPRSSVAPQ